MYKIKKNFFILTEKNGKEPENFLKDNKNPTTNIK